MKRAVIVIMPGVADEEKQLKVLMAFCTAERLQPVSILHGDPRAAVPLIVDGMVKTIVVACADHSGMAEIAELAAELAGGDLRYARRSERQAASRRRTSRTVNPIIGRLLDRGVKPDEIAEIVGLSLQSVLEQIVLARRESPTIPQQRARTGPRQAPADHPWRESNGVPFPSPRRSESMR